MAATARPVTAFRLTGWHVLAMLIGFFVVIFAVNTIFIVQAVSTFPGEHTKKSYLQGLHYNDTLKRREAERALGWQAEAALLGDEGGRSTLRIRLTGKDNAALDGVTLTGVLRRPVTDTQDIKLAFTAGAPGLYIAPIGVLPDGSWDMRVTAARDGQSLEITKRLWSR
jgi:nitrogen fixation protein FixH